MKHTDWRCVRVDKYESGYRAALIHKDETDKDGRRIVGTIIHMTDSFRRKKQAIRDLKRELSSVSAL